jgi:Tim44-like domain
MKRSQLLNIFLAFVAQNSFAATKTAKSAANNLNNTDASLIIYTWVILVILIIVGVVVYVMFKKQPVLEDSATDPLWKQQFLHDYTDDVFYLMQDAWKLRDLQPVRHLMTDQMVKVYQDHFDKMKEEGEVNVIKLIEIHEIQIVPDHISNDEVHQSYTAIIDGAMVDAGINEFTGEPIYNGDLELDYFRDFYHFVRSEERWLLEFIDKKSLLHKVLGDNIHKEKNEKHK